MQRISDFLSMNLVLGALLLGGASAQERIGSTSQPLTITNVSDWRSNGNTIPVCWETPGYDREKDIVQAALKGTWQWYANLQFTGWGLAPLAGSAAAPPSSRSAFAFLRRAPTMRVQAVRPVWAGRAEQRNGQQSGRQPLVQSGRQRRPGPGGIRRRARVRARAGLYP